MAFLEAPNPLVNLRRILQLPLLDPLAQGCQIRQKPVLMRLPDGPILLLPPGTPTEDMGFP